MADYIVDASIVIDHLIQGPYTVNTDALFDTLAPSDGLIVPEFCLLECTNVLWKQVRFQGMPQKQATLLLRDLRRLPLERTPVKRLLGRALQIGLKHQLAVYDSLYIALAERTRHPLITIDQPQTRAASAEGVILKPISDFK
jgi:predicted nucleic acid-binding protein